jgi:hypothetical protein
VSPSVMFPSVNVYALLELMYPNDPNQSPQLPPAAPTQPQPLSSDYLNQIAAPARVKTLNPLVLWGLIGGLLVLAIVVVLGVSSASSGPSPSSLASIAANFNNLKSLSEDAQDNIQSSELRTLNSSLTLSLTNTNRDLTEPLAKQDINLKDKKNATVISVAEKYEELGSRLEDARLNAVYDRTYAREMTYVIKTLRSDMAILYKKSRSSDLKTALETADKNLKPIVEGFDGFNAS